MRKSIADIRQLLVRAWGRVVSVEKAEYIADAIICAALSKDARMNPLREAIHDLKDSVKTTPTHKIVLDYGASCILDFGGTSPFGQMMEIHEMLKDRSKKCGVASVAMRNTAGIHQLSTWVEPLSRSGELLSLFVWNGGSYTVAPFGSMEPFFGTNPIAYAIPTNDQPIICDMATSEVPFLSLMQALKSDKELDRIAGLDEHGKQTRNSRDIYDPDIDGPVRLLPMGLGYKGSAIMLLIEIVTGALIGAKMGREANDQNFTPSEFGGWLVAVNIGMFTQLSEFKSRVSGLCDQIRHSKRARDVEAVMMPGDRALATYKMKMESGILDISDEDYASLLKIAG